MQRRLFLATVGTTVAGGIAGCALAAPGVENTANRDSRSGHTSDSRNESRRGSEAETRRESDGEGRSGRDPSLADRPLGRSGFPAEICSEPPQNDPGIYAITEPAFDTDWDGRAIDEQYLVGPGTGLDPEQTVIGLERDGQSRAYPVKVLRIHEVLNETLDGTPLLVTYCSLCRSGMVAQRVVDGSVTTFRATGLLWAAPQLREAVAEEEGRVFGAEVSGGKRLSVRHSGNVVMLDNATGSYWSQILAQAICGPKEGTVLQQVPASVTTWRNWQAEQSDTVVLLPPPYSETTIDSTSIDARRIRDGTSGE